MTSSARISPRIVPAARAGTGTNSTRLRLPSVRISALCSPRGGGHGYQRGEARLVRERDRLDLDQRPRGEARDLDRRPRRRGVAAITAGDRGHGWEVAPG